MDAQQLPGTTELVTGALRRERAHLRQQAPSEDEVREPADAEQRTLVDQYAMAFENADVSALMELLRDDAVFEMPPMPTWFAGREQVACFLRSRVLRHPGGFVMIPAAANGQPALAAYARGLRSRPRRRVPRTRPPGAYPQRPCHHPRRLLQRLLSTGDVRPADDPPRQRRAKVG